METETIDITPNPEAYEQVLKEIQKNAESPEYRAWATVELQRCKPAFDRGYWTKPSSK